MDVELEAGKARGRSMLTTEDGGVFCGSRCLNLLWRVRGVGVVLV